MPGGMRSEGDGGSDKLRRAFFVCLTEFVFSFVGEGELISNFE